MELDEITLKVRNWLLSNQIKLWEPPYNDSDQSDQSINKLAVKIVEDLSISLELIQTVLKTLMQNSLVNISSRKFFETTQIATLKIKLPKIMRSVNNDSTILIKINLQSNTGKDLKQSISEVLQHHNQESMKVIVSGQLIKDDLLLSDQNVKNNSQCLLLLTEAEASESTKNDQEEIDKIYRAARFLADKSADVNYHSDKYDLHITNQNGKTLDLPTDEKKALTLALTIHEKAKGIMQRKEYNCALPVLLLADEEFRKCTADILQSVDNFPLLQLDIVWCFLNLERITELQDAARRLSESEVGIKNCYGNDFQRARTVHKTSGSVEQLVILFRLHLMQAVCSFHQNRLSEARVYLNSAIEEYNKLMVDDKKLQSVMELGFSAQEGRIGLRSCNGIIDEALEYLFKRKEELKQNKKERQLLKKKNALRNKLGTTIDGSDIEVNLIETLVSMGFHREHSLEAVRQSNNSLNDALQLLDNKLDFLQLSIDKRRSKGLDVSGTTSTCDQDMVKELIRELQVPEEVIKTALEVVHNDLNRATELVLSGEIPSTSLAGASNHHEKSEVDVIGEEEVVTTLLSDISSPDDYIDPNLHEEVVILMKYASLLDVQFPTM